MRRKLNGAKRYTEAVDWIGLHRADTVVLGRDRVAEKNQMPKTKYQGRVKFQL